LLLEIREQIGMFGVVHFDAIFMEEDNELPKLEVL